MYFDDMISTSTFQIDLNSIEDKSVDVIRVWTDTNKDIHMTLKIKGKVNKQKVVLYIPNMVVPTGGELLAVNGCSGKFVRYQNRGVYLEKGDGKFRDWANNYQEVSVEDVFYAITHEQTTKEMTVKEIEEELGYPIKIVSEKEKNK